MLSFNKSPPSIAPISSKRPAFMMRAENGKPTAPLVMSEGSRYEHLRLTAEKLMQQQTLSKSAGEVMQERIALLERSDALKENQLRTLREERSKLSTMLSNEQKVFQKLEFELQVVQTLEASLKEQILLFEKRTAEGKRDRDDLQSTIDGLQMEYEKSQAKVGELHAMNEKAEAQIADLRATESRLKEDMGRLIEHHRTLLHARENAWSGERQQFELNICSLREAIEQAQGDCKSLGEQLATEKIIVDELNARLSSEISQRQKLSEELSASLEKNAHLSDALAQETARCLMKDSEILKCTDQLQERARVLAQVEEEHASVVASLVATRDSLATANTSLESAHTREEQLVELLSRERKENELLNNSLSALQKDLSEQRDCAAVRLLELQQLQSAMQAKESKLAELAEAKSTLVQEIDAKDRQIKLAEQRILANEAAHSKLREQFDSVSEQLAQKTVDESRAKRNEDDVRTVRAEFQKALSASAEAQAVQHARIQELEAKLAAQAQQLEQAALRHQQEISTLELAHQKELIGMRRETEEKLARGYESRGYESAKEKLAAARTATATATVSAPPVGVKTPSTATSVPPAASELVATSSQRSAAAIATAAVASLRDEYISDAEDLEDILPPPPPPPTPANKPASFYAAKSVVHSQHSKKDGGDDTVTTRKDSSRSSSAAGVTTKERRVVVSRSEGSQGLSKKILKFVEQDVREEIRGPATKKKAAKEKDQRKQRKGKVDLFDDVFTFNG